MRIIKGFIVVVFMITISNVYSQYGIGINNPNPNAVVHMVSPDSSQGVIIPKVVQLNRPIAVDAIKGMMIFNITDSVFQLCDGTRWISISVDSLADNDFYKSGTSKASFNIIDSIYTLGNVGIGDSVPKSRLHIHENSSSYANILLTNNTTTDTSEYNGFRIGLGSDEIGRLVGGINVNAIQIASDSMLTLSKPGFHLDIPTNNVGIGKGNPQYNLDVDSNINTAGHYFQYGEVILTTNPNDKGSGQRNIAVGEGALDSLKTGAQNTALGYRALQNDTSGSHNTSIGAFSLEQNLSGIGNTAVGRFVMNENTAGSYNTSVGYNALKSNDTADFNVAIGGFSMTENISGERNVAVGYLSMQNNISGESNTALGFNALRFNDSANNNTAIGKFSLYTNTNGYNNVAVGANALFLNDTGFQNVAVGANSLRSNLSGFNNVAIGNLTLFDNTIGNNNTAIGGGVLRLNTIGDGNVGVGRIALYNNVTGDNNAAVGSNSMFGNVSGTGNAALGSSTLYSNTSGEQNSAIGNTALYSNTTGNNNVGIGYTALRSSTTASNNTAIGNSAMRYNILGEFNTAIGSNALIRNINNDENTALGRSAFSLVFVPDVANQVSFSPTDVDTSKGYILISGGHGLLPIGTNREMQISSTGTVPAPLIPGTNYLVLLVNDSVLDIGSGLTSQGTGVITLTPHDTSAYDINNSTALGYNSRPTKSNQVILGDSRIEEVVTRGDLIPTTNGVQNIGSSAERWDTIFAATGTIQTSDVRLKKDIKGLTYGLNEVLKLEPITYKWKDRESKNPKIGFKAQQLMEVIPEVVNVGNDENKTLGVFYSDIVPVNTKAIQELHQLVKKQEAQIKDQNELIESLIERLEKLEDK